MPTQVLTTVIPIENCVDNRAIEHPKVPVTVVQPEQGKSRINLFARVGKIRLDSIGSATAPDVGAQRFPRYSTKVEAKIGAYPEKDAKAENRLCSRFSHVTITYMPGHRSKRF